MRLRAAPALFHFLPDPLWERTKEFKRLVAMLLADPNASLPATLTRNQFVLVEAAYVRTRWPHLLLTHRDFGLAMERAINESKLVLAAPERDTPTEDLIAVWTQPEARAFLERVMMSAGPTRVSAPGLHFALLVMLVLSSLRATTHIRATYNIIVHNEALRRFASEFALSCPRGLAMRARASELRTGNAPDATTVGSARRRGARHARRDRIRIDFVRLSRGSLPRVRRHSSPSLGPATLQPHQRDGQPRA
jgi:hypothetical protein